MDSERGRRRNEGSLLFSFCSHPSSCLFPSALHPFSLRLSLSLFAFYFSAALILPSPCIWSFLSSLRCFSACFPFSLSTSAFLFASPSSLFHPLLSKIFLCLSLIHFDSLSFPSKHFSNYLSAIFFLDL